MEKAEKNKKTGIVKIIAPIAVISLASILWCNNYEDEYLYYKRKYEQEKYKKEIIENVAINANKRDSANLKIIDSLQELLYIREWKILELTNKLNDTKTLLYECQNKMIGKK